MGQLPDERKREYCAAFVAFASPSASPWAALPRARRLQLLWELQLGLFPDLRSSRFFATLEAAFRKLCDATSHAVQVQAFKLALARGLDAIDAEDANGMPEWLDWDKLGGQVWGRPV